jgi:hypothetical protein
MAENHSEVSPLVADLVREALALSNSEGSASLDDLFVLRAKVDGLIVKAVGEAERAETFRDDGATSAEAWLVERFGVSTATARAYAHVGEKESELPHLVGSLCAGEVSFDKVRVVADVATPRNERELCEQAKECTVRELADIARSAGELARASSPTQGRTEHERRFVRFNDEHRTMSVQLPRDSYAETRARVEAVAKEIPSDGETPWDQRCADAMTELIHGSGDGSGDGSSTAAGTGGGATASPYVVVVHAPLGALVEESGQASELAADLERHGLIDAETLGRIACDATIVIAADDDVGHTMYEGRARRFPTQTQRREIMRRDRHCRFPGCTNVTFANVHHIVAWKPGGRTDLPNMVLVCRHHHGLVHRKVWTMSGNANEELTFVGPGGRVMTSRPSSKWTRVTPGRS